MNYKELQEILENNNTKSTILISNMIFKIDEIKVEWINNPVTETTTRGGVYIADKNELKVQATIFNTNITKYLSKTMLGPNKTFLDIFIEVKTNNNKKISLVTNLTNSMQNSSKIVLYLTLKKIIKN